ncbi:MAG: tetratricopeptide repeat protein, partial [Bacteroidaceae bacterium]
MNTEIRVTELIGHPEQMNRDTLMSLQDMLSQHPYYQTARLLYLHNLYILHEESFDAELKKAALYIADRQVLFYMAEGQNYTIQPESNNAHKEYESAEHNRTVSLINRFLTEQPEDSIVKHELTPADATTDYAAYLLQMEDVDIPEVEESALQLKGQNLIDDFIERKQERFVLPEETEFIPEADLEPENDEDYFTETLARIYIKQGRYSKAIEIIHKLSLNYPKKNSYFADQIRFLEK